MAPLNVAGYLRMSEKSKRMNSQGKELYRFVPLANTAISDAYPEFNANTSTILVASGAASDRKKVKQKSNNFMPDLYVLVEILEEERKGDEWKARVVEMLGECTDLHSCGLVLAHKGRLLDGNKALDSNKPPRTDEKKSAGPKSVFDSKVTAAAVAPAPSPCILTDDRVDLRAAKCTTIFSVDPPGCVDIDDAVHVRVYSAEERATLEPAVITKLNLETSAATERSNILSNTVLYEVGIHIADVVNYVKNHCHTQEPSGPETEATVSVQDPTLPKIDQRMQKIALEALHRSFTVYLPNQQIPILPAYLSHEACSLQAGEDRYTMSCIVTLAASVDPAGDSGTTDPTNIEATTGTATTAIAQGRTFAQENTSVPLENPPEQRAYQVISYRFQKSLINSAGAFTYDQIDQYLDGNATTVASSTTTSATTTTNIKDKSSKTSTKPPSSTDTTSKTQSKGLPKDVKYSLKLLRKLFPSLDSHKIIEQLMLMANICAAEFLQTQTALTDGTNDAHCDTLSAYLLRRQLPAGYDPLLPPDSAENFAVLTAKAAAVPTHAQRGVFTGVPAELTTHPAEYILCPATTSGVPTDSATLSTTTDGMHVAQLKHLSEVEMAHASLGCAVYTHFTSPIRRYADQLVHALMNRLLVRNTPSLDTSMAALSLTPSSVVMADPWLLSLTPANVAHINAKQKQHKKFQREMTIVEFVFSQCAAVGANEATIDAEAVVLPMRYSDKHRGYKADLFVLAPCSFVYPLRLHTRAQASLYEATYTARGVSLRHKHTGEVKRLQVGQKIPVQVHCSRSAASMRKKCVVSSTQISF